MGFAAYADVILAQLAGARRDPVALATWLAECGAITPEQGSVTQAAIQGAGKADIVVVLRDPTSDELMARGVLLVFHDQEGGYRLARKVEGVGTLALLKVDDINKDGKVDIAWSDTTCGAHTCFSTLYVESWDGKAYRDWIEGEPTMAYPEYRFEDSESAGNGEEILVHGGIIRSAGAGPQRAWTETYISPKGKPYQLFNQVYDASDCFYHHLLDANRIFNEWASAGFGPAVTAYQALIGDTSLRACGTIANELETLRDFARFRLIVSLVSNGQANQASSVLGQIGNQALRGAAQAFLEAYKKSGSIVQACRNTTAYALTNPGSWEFLADWGYANPSFSPEELCPLG